MSAVRSARGLAGGLVLAAVAWRVEGQAAAPSRPPAASVEAERLFAAAAAEQIAVERGAGDAEAGARAVAGYRKVIALQPSAAAPRYNLARLLQSQGDDAGALAGYRAAADLPGADQPFYLRQLADFLTRTGRAAAADEALVRLVLREPRNEDAHRTVSAHLLEQAGEPRALLEYAWQLFAAAQYGRAEDLALAALARGFPAWSRAELLTVVAAGLGRQAIAARDLREGDVAARLRALAGDAAVGRGVEQLLGLYRLAQGGTVGELSWWDVPDLEWAYERGVARRDAIRMVLRAVGAGYERAGDLTSAEGCYRAAIDAPSGPDAVALRELADVYVERGDLDRLQGLATRYADPEGRLFQAKSEAYRQGQLETVLEYHRALGEILGNLARNGKTGWGDTATPTSALFQLTRAYDVGRRLDCDGCADPAAKATHLDPGIAVLLAEGLQATAGPQPANAVRLDAAARFERAGDAHARDVVLQGVKEEALSEPERQRYQQYRRAPAQGPGSPPLTAGAAATRQPSVSFKASAAVGTYALAAPPTRQPGAAVAVPANVAWVDTGIDVAAGATLEIAARGTWSNAGPPAVGPAGLGPVTGTVLATAPVAALVGRIADRLFLVGARFRGSAPAAGRLFLGINDVPGRYADNQGVVTVTVDLR